MQNHQVVPHTHSCWCYIKTLKKMCVCSPTTLCDFGILLYVQSKGYDSTNTVSPIKGIYPAVYDSIHKSWVWGGWVCDPVPWRVYWGSPPLPSECCWASPPARAAVSCVGRAEQRAATHWCRHRQNLGPQPSQQQCSSSGNKTGDGWRNFRWRQELE